MVAGSGDRFDNTVLFDMVPSRVEIATHQTALLKAERSSLLATPRMQKMPTELQGIKVDRGR